MVMKKMIISLVIEAKGEDLHEIKGKIIETASESLVSVTTNVLGEQTKEEKQKLEIPATIGLW